MKAAELKQKALGLLSEKGKDAQKYLFQVAAQLATAPVNGAATATAETDAAETNKAD